jgi:drug/metabolite transporter (DMT)-like permease
MDVILVRKADHRCHFNALWYLPRMRHYLLLILATSIWGFGFIAAKWSLELYGPYWANTLRFLMATVLSIPFFVIYKTHKQELKYFGPPFIAGTLIYFGMHFQTLGLNFTSVAKSGFLTSFYVIFIPLIAILFRKRSYSFVFWFYVLLALMGVALLCELKFSGFNIGDFYTLLCALAFAVHILYIDKITQSYNSFELNGLQFLTALLWGVPASFLMEGGVDLMPLLLPENDLALYGILFLGFFSSVLAFSIQLIAQKKIPPHVAGFFFLLESPFAAVFGFYFLQEHLGVLQISGCALILFAVLAVQRKVA